MLQIRSTLLQVEPRLMGMGVRVAMGIIRVLVLRCESPPWVHLPSCARW